MTLGYDGKLYILAFDHRGSFERMLGASSDDGPEGQRKVEDAKSLIFDGMVVATETGEEPDHLGVLVDEQYGGDIPKMAKQHGLKLAMPVEKSGQDVFDFEYGEQFGEHIEQFDPDFSKVLVRWNPEDDAESNRTQGQRLKRLSDWLHERDRKFLFELLVPATEAQLEKVAGEKSRYDVEARPELMRRAMEELQDAGVEPDIWKIEGVETNNDCAMLAEQARRDGRDDVVCVLLGRGADDEKVEQWLYAAAPIDGFVGFAIGRTIWSGPLQSYLDGEMKREDAAAAVAANYGRFIEVWRRGE